MMTDITARWRQAEISEPKATAAIAWLTDAPVDQIRGWVLVAIRDLPDNPGQLTLVSTFGTDRQAVSKLLAHASGHIVGKCRSCARIARRQNHVKG